MKLTSSIPYIALLAAALSGCASSLSESSYQRGETGVAQEVQLGVVESVREVKIEGTKSGVGAVSGGMVGSVAGSNVGSGKGSIVGSILGAVAGGVTGAAAEEGITRQKGYEITVKLDSGRVIAVTQGADEQFKPGERVRILGSGGKTRVTH
ncbi:MAG TPA: hypothetical protein VIU46_03260 [Gallionellaceae bacterium]